MRHLITITLLIVTTFIAGCGAGVKISGKVTYEDDGSPLKWGGVVLETEKNSFLGSIKPTGNYAVGVTRDNQKIPPGTYKVWLTNTARAEAMYNKKGEVIEGTFVAPQILGEYESPKTTPFSLEVKAGGSSTFDIVVKRHPDWQKQQKYGPSGSTAGK